MNPNGVGLRRPMGPRRAPAWPARDEDTPAEEQRDNESDLDCRQNGGPDERPEEAQRGPAEQETANPSAPRSGARTSRRTRPIIGAAEGIDHRDGHRCTRDGYGSRGGCGGVLGHRAEVVVVGPVYLLEGEGG